MQRQALRTMHELVRSLVRLWQTLRGVLSILAGSLGRLQRRDISSGLRGMPLERAKEGLHLGRQSLLDKPPPLGLSVSAQ